MSESCGKAVRRGMLAGRHRIWILLWIAVSFLYYFWMFLSNLIRAV